ncbi:sensor domain-containing diguanylate cyclase [Chloroflexota bacterium]
MDFYALFPLIATIAFIPMLATTAASRPWQRRHTLFLIFLASAMAWSLIDYLLYSGLFHAYDLLFIKAGYIAFPLMAVQFHCFISSFYAPGQGRWLPYAYSVLAATIISVVLGYVPGGIEVRHDRLFAVHGIEMAFVALALLVLVVRTFYVFLKRLKTLDNPVLYNQLISLLFGLGAVTVFSFTSLFPWGVEYAVSHFGNLLNAFILSYAVIRHRLVDIKLVLRQGSAWVSLGIVGMVSYWLVLMALHAMFRFELDLKASLIATVLSVVVSVFIYRLRGSLFETMSRIFQGPSYDYRQQLADFTITIHNVFSLREQGAELLALLSKAVGIKKACLLFPEVDREGFNAQLAEPEGEDNELSSLKLKKDHFVIQYLEREQKTLSRENMSILPEFLGLWEQEREEIEPKGIEMFIPLISRGHLIAILVLGRKQSGKYSLGDLHLLEDIAGRVAVSMEKEYLREQLREREEELSVINRSNTIITSSLDIQEIFDSFIKELKNVVDVSWAAIVLVEETGLSFLALSSEVEYARRVGEMVMMKGSGTEWVVNHKEAVVEADLSRESRYTAGEELRSQGIRSIVYLPLMAKGAAIGSFIVASRQPQAYSQRNVALLEQLASQIAMPVENSRLYARTAEKARIDGLTGLLNRRSLDEMMDTEVSRNSRYGGVFSLAILDLDSFKRFNDSYGHLAGDKLLRQVGQIIKSAVRSSDQAFRYGGDEFAVLLHETAIDAASEVAERIRQEIAARVESGDIKITASIGLASWPADGIGQVDIIAAADMALYRAKKRGGNQSCYASGPLLPVDVADSGLGENKDSKGRK